MKDERGEEIGGGGRTGQGQAAGLKFGSEGGLSWGGFVWELEVCFEDVDRPELVR